VKSGLDPCAAGSRSYDSWRRAAKNFDSSDTRVMIGNGAILADTCGFPGNDDNGADRDLVQLARGRCACALHPFRPSALRPPDHV
jgi:hypothetical protein